MKRIGVVAAMVYHSVAWPAPLSANSELTAKVAA